LKKVDKWLAKLAKERNLELERLREEYALIRSDLEKRGMKGDLDAIAKNMLMVKYREYKTLKRKRKYPLENFVGFKIGDIGLTDDAQRMREWARYVVDRYGLEYAKQQGLVEEREDEIVVLDTRKTIFGRENKNYGKPLPPDLKLRRRDLIFLAKKADDEEFMFTRIQTKDNKLAVAWGDVPFHVPVSFTAAVQTADASGYLLSSSSAKATMTVFREIKEKWDVYKIFKKWADENLTPIRDALKFHEATKDAWDRWILLKGIVASINFENETYRGIPATLVDTETGYSAEDSILFYIPDHLKVNFGVYSEIYLLGKTRGIQEVDEETGAKFTVDVTVDAWGFFPVPGKSTEPQESLLEEEGEEEIKGFIPAE